MEIAIVNANSVEHYPSPRFAASDVGLHCLPMFFVLFYSLKSLMKIVSVRYFCISCTIL